LQAAEAALIDSGHDDVMVWTKRRSFHWMTFERARRLRQARPRLARGGRGEDLERDIIQSIIAGEYTKPVKVVAFDLEKHWVKDVMEPSRGRSLQPSAPKA
jgi:hypothetical protein